VAATDTQPGAVDQASNENLNWGFDATPYLNSMGDTGISDPTGVLLDVTSTVYENVTLADDPSVSGNIITQRVLGSVLTAGHRYWLLINYTSTPSGNQPGMRLQINCPY
jgi:hypothetical protein